MSRFAGLRAPVLRAALAVAAAADAILADWDEIDRLIGAPGLRPRPRLQP